MPGIRSFHTILFKWYSHHRRELPWRRTKDPYKIWISEVILQQTRISQGTDYYLRFIKKFPDIKSLAKATEQEVLKEWQGLGYYTRARNLHAAARELVSKHHGKFPLTYEEIRSLKGIGNYTAAAIASISFGLPYPVLDGNVYRFFSRHFGIKFPAGSSSGKKEVMRIASELIDPSRSGDFNQAVMEFGALHCIPANPDCLKCPFRSSCYAFLNGKVGDLPVRNKSTSPANRYFNYLVISKKKDPGRIFIRLREQNDIWKNLYDFPLVETNKRTEPETLVRSNEWKQIFGKAATKIISVSPEHIHVLSHQRIHATFISVEITGKITLPYVSFDASMKKKYPFPRLIAKYLDEHFFH